LILLTSDAEGMGVDLGYMINHAMFQRNGRAGYVLKPRALRDPTKDLLNQRTKHFLDVTVISAQQLPRRKDKLGREVIDKSMMDPLVEVSVHIPDWTHSPFVPANAEAQGGSYSPASGPTPTSATTARTMSFRTAPVKNNGFNPVWEERFSLPFDCLGDMKELVFVRFAVREDSDDDDDEPIALYCASLGTLQQGRFSLLFRRLSGLELTVVLPGYRHLPLHDAQLSQYLFSTLFVQINIRDA
jgi:phosphatidylinositol phospholipase C delta